jgi:mRNA-degrading endonuclease RelE of RelBE toxin-antitoxin system
MLWKLAYEPKVERDLEKLNPHIQAMIAGKLAWFVANFGNAPHERLHGKLAAYQKLRVGDFRVVYSVEYSSTTLRVKGVDRRDKVYKPKGRK